ncbi:MAG: DUF2207 domain-containing protein [Chloroflexi bacterium]|nr:DUF2207 domain-containing protein [Chloroflexota bacterium]
MWRKLIILILVSCTILFSAGSIVAQEKSYSADRFDVDIVVQEDGSLLVTETVLFSFVGEPFTFVFRELPTNLTDGITILGAAVDGRSYPGGTNVGQVEIEEGRDIRVTWHMEPTANVTRSFVLQYQVFGVVRQADNADLLRYQPLPDEFEYFIDSSTVTVSYPETAVVQTPLTITAGSGNIRQENPIVLTSQEIDPNATMVFEMSFEEGTLIATPPAWQARQAEQKALAPIWLGIGFLILLTGIGGSIWIWRNHQPKQKWKTAVLYEPPNTLAPAMAGVLNSSAASPSWTNALATLFDLADRGVLSIEELEKKSRFHSNDFDIVLQQEPIDLQPHEQGLLDLLFETKDGRETAVKMSKLSSAISGKRWKKFTEPLKAEMKAAGYIDEARKTERQWILGGSIIILILGILALIAMPLTLYALFGIWPIAIALSLLIVSMILIGVGSSLTILTDEAKMMADKWQSFYQHMKDVTRKKAAVGSTDMFMHFLPYAASYGLLHQWAKFFQKEGWTELPPYFHALSQSGKHGGMNAFVAMTATSASSGGSAAGGAGAGAGAAGGGASGAG